jgi:hypothetical protein
LGASVTGYSRGPEYTPIVSHPNPSGESLAAGSSRSEQMRFSFVSEEIEALKKGRFWGHYQIFVSYIDIFGHKRMTADADCYIPQFRDFRTCAQGQIHD